MIKMFVPSKGIMFFPCHGKMLPSKKSWHGCVLKASSFKKKMPGDSKWPFYPLVGGHLTFPKGHLTIPKRSLWITWWLSFPTSHHFHVDRIWGAFVSSFWEKTHLCEGVISASFKAVFPGRLRATPRYRTPVRPSPITNYERIPFFFACL